MTATTMATKSVRVFNRKEDISFVCESQGLACRVHAGVREREGMTSLCLFIFHSHRTHVAHVLSECHA